MFGLGPAELVIIALIILLLFGPALVKRLDATVHETRKQLKEIERDE